MRKWGFYKAFCHGMYVLIYRFYQPLVRFVKWIFTKFSRLCRTQRFYCCVHKCLPLHPLLGQIKPVHCLSTHCSEIYFNGILQSTPRYSKYSYLFRSDHESSPCWSLDLTCHLPCSSYAPRYHIPTAFGEDSINCCALTKTYLKYTGDTFRHYTCHSCLFYTECPIKNLGKTW